MRMPRYERRMTPRRSDSAIESSRASRARGRRMRRRSESTTKRPSTPKDPRHGMFSLWGESESTAVTKEKSGEAFVHHWKEVNRSAPAASRKEKSSARRDVSFRVRKNAKRREARITPSTHCEV